MVRSAPLVDRAVARSLARWVALPGVRRVGLALAEGGGRRLQFVAATPDEPVVDEALDWCLIDAFDDVPLAAVVRTGEALWLRLDDGPRPGERFAGVLAKQRSEATLALAALPLPGPGGARGGVILFYDERPTFDLDQRDALLAMAAEDGRALDEAAAVDLGSETLIPVPEPRDGDAPLRVEALTLAPDPRAPGEARRFLRRLLEAWRVHEEVADTAQLCVSELVTNAVVHAQTTSEVQVRLDADALTVTVADRGAAVVPDAAVGSAPAPAVTGGEVLPVHGRGLRLVAALARDWGASRDRRGTTVWFELDVTAVGARA